MKVVIDSRFSDQTDFLCRIPQMMAAGEGETFFKRRNTVARFREGGHVFIAKRYKRVNFVQQIAYTFFRKTKAERAYLYTAEYQRRGIDVPERVAYMEQSRYGLFSLGHYVSLEVAGMDVHPLLRDVEVFDRELADAVAAHIVLMHSRGILHGDLNLSNFLCRKEDDGWHFTVIDLNRTRFHDGTPPDGLCLKNLVRMTHRRDLYEYIVSTYAKLRGWQVESTVCEAVKLLDKFENKKRFF